MSKIKSALELALERTADVKIDKEAVRREEAVSKGKSLAGRYLSSPEEVSFQEELKKADKPEAGWIKEGILETLLANLTLPRYESDIDKLTPVAAGLKVLAGKGPGSRNLDYILDQYKKLFQQYMENLGQLETGLRAQWAPRLRQKEEMLRKQTGQSFALAPEQDPEYNKVLSEQIAEMDAQYNEVIDRSKAEIRKLL
ncbi:MAG: hypothetical protein B0D92_02490 [Spirochaeta sp. LUC14_002_19_P3]|nr:MAG: hypothetical protein B0D92_02490 [Spirochaeta sp. LUC14_002_19_P3]